MENQALFDQLFSSDQNTRISAILWFRRASERTTPSFWQDGQGRTPYPLQVFWIVTHPECCVVKDNQVEVNVPAGLKLDLAALVDWLARALQREPVIAEWYPHLPAFVSSNIAS